jgi:type VI secretion system protein ImpC
MANEQQTAGGKTTTTVEAGSLLDQVLTATKQTERSRAEDLVRTLAEEALKGTVTYSKNITVTINQAIKAIDAAVSKQLNAVMHHPDFLKLEGSWRGLHHLVMNSETSTNLKLKVFNVSKKDLFKDVDKAVEFDQSQIFKKLYENEFGTPGGEPYGTLIGDYEFTNHPEDLELLSKMSNVAAAAFCPFVTAADPKLFGFDAGWTDLSKPRDLAKVFDSAEYTKWKSFRDSDDSRFVALTMPRVLARLPYGAITKPVETFGYEEGDFDASGKPQELDHHHYCWMNASYVMGTKLTEAFAKYGWCVAIRGHDSGGKVEGLPTHVTVSSEGDPNIKCPTEIGITDRREKELSDLGFLPLCHYKNTDYAVFFGAQTAQKPKKYDQPAATANAAISARLPYIMASSRIAHYLKVMARDKIGSFMQATDCEKWLNNWIKNYINSNPEAGQEMKAKYPLAEAKITVKEIEGKPGSFNAIAYLRPWLQFEELTTSLRMVARIPKLG